jgi:hypothetical protein
MDQVAQQPVQAGLAVELVEDQPDHGLDLLVGVQGQGAVGQFDGADGRVAEQLAAPRLVQLALIHPVLEGVQFGLAQGALQPQQKAVVEVGGVVQPVGVSQQDAQAGAQSQEAVPGGAAAGQAAHLQAEDQADVVEGDLGQQALEAQATLDGLAAAPQVVVDNQDAVARPAQGTGAVGQGVLAGGRFDVLEDLLGSRLSDVDDGETVEVPGLELGRTQGVIHGRPPGGCWPRGAGPTAGPAGSEVGAAGPSADWPTASAGPPLGGSSQASGAWRGGGHVAPP